MCLILFSLGTHPGYRLIIAANRDESYGRPTAPFAFWPEAAQVAAGKDLEGGGTWLGITRRGRWAALTNFRQAGTYRASAPSRGRLVSDYLIGDVPPERYVEQLEPRAHIYNGFNLLLGAGEDVFYCSNRNAQCEQVPAGIHGLSNHLLNTPWPKVEMGKAALRSLPDSATDPASVLLAALAERRLPPDEDLPDTGVGLAAERVLSPPFIAAESYGTRASTIIAIDASGMVSIAEHRFGRFGVPEGATSLSFRLDPDVQWPGLQATAASGA
ncbi:MAG: NRDE family protein [Burkholderiales bacterium]|nr:NRDE family protein [Burkholderiales bacterium]